MNYRLRNTLHNIAIGAVVGATLAGMYLGLVAMSNLRNDQKQADCIQQGGEFYRAGWSGRSLCKIPNKAK